MPPGSRLLDLLSRVDALYLLFLERTLALPRLAALLPASPPEVAATWAAALAGAAVLALWGALASGGDRLVATFRAGCFLLAPALPLAALQLAGTAHRGPFTAVTLLLVLALAFVHRSLRARRKEGLAERLLSRARWTAELAGLTLFATGAGFLLSGRPVPVRLAFWTLFLLRVSTVDLIDPARLAERIGLTKSAARDVKTALAAGARRKPRALTRARRALLGIGKGLLLAVWVTLPAVAALAEGEVARGEWPREMLAFRSFPPVALLLAAAFVLVTSLGSLREEPIDALRGLVASIATGLWLLFVLTEPGFEGYRRSLPGLVLVESLAGFLVGTARRR